MEQEQGHRSCRLEWASPSEYFGFILARMYVLATFASDCKLRGLASDIFSLQTLNLGYRLREALLHNMSFSLECNDGAAY
jgi:hypothetical protein